MFVDLTLPLDGELLKKAFNEEKITFNGHMGTHFDVMGKSFPLSYCEREGVVYDISNIKDRDVEEKDLDLSNLKEGMFVGFYSGWGKQHPYGSAPYFHEHPQLSVSLLEKLTEKEVSMIGIDFAGVRRGKEHTPIDQYCADRGCFIIENLVNLDKLVERDRCFHIHVYPLNFKGLSGLPCRVVAEYDDKNC